MAFLFVDLADNNFLLLVRICFIPVSLKNLINAVFFGNPRCALNKANPPSPSFIPVFPSVLLIFLLLLKIVVLVFSDWLLIFQFLVSA
jgi:hypothetical protein